MSKLKSFCVQANNKQTTTKQTNKHNKQNKESVRLLRARAVQRLALFGYLNIKAHVQILLVNSGVHGIAYGLGQRLGNITDATADQLDGLVWVGLCPGSDTAADFRKEVTGFELEEVFVDLHGMG